MANHVGHVTWVWIGPASSASGLVQRHVQPDSRNGAATGVAHAAKGLCLFQNYECFLMLFAENYTSSSQTNSQWTAIYFLCAHYAYGGHERDKTGRFLCSLVGFISDILFNAPVDRKSLLNMAVAALSYPWHNYLLLLFHLISNPTLHIETRLPQQRHLHLYTRMVPALHNLIPMLSRRNP